MISQLQKEIAEKDSDKEEIADRVIKNPESLEEIFEGLNANKANIKYGCEKVLRLISEKNPAVLYPWFDFFVELLNSDNNFLNWGAIKIIANLTTVDSENKFESIFSKYFAPIPGPQLIPAANTIDSAAIIVLTKPHLTDRITRELLKVEKARYQTVECRNIALGKAIKSFDQFFDQIEDKEPVIKLIKKQLKNTRNATKKKAEKFLKKWLN